MTIMKHPPQLVHAMTIPVRWGDMDALGHVSNSVYFRYADEARIAWLASFGIDVSLDSEGGPVVVNVHCTFLRPVTYPATVEIRTLLGEPGRTSVQTFFEIRIVGEDPIYAEGGAKMVWWSPRAGKSKELPEFIRALKQNL